MSSPDRRAVLCALTLTLSACGFKPIYGGADRDAAAANLGAIEVAPINGRLGFLMREDLRKRLGFAESHEPAYRLNVRASRSREGLAIQQDNTVTRFNTTVRGDFELVDIKTGKSLFKDQVSTIVSYNATASQFATRTARQAAEARGARNVSQKIINRLLTNAARKTSG